MHILARISPAQMLKKAVTAAKKSRVEKIRKRGFLPTISEVMPAMKLPTAYAPKVHRVSVSRSSMSRKMTPRTKRPESQNW